MRTLAICDGHRLFGEALAQVLIARGHHVVACTHDPDAGVAAVRAHHPDVYLTDLPFPGSAGVDAVAAARAASPGTHVLVLAGTADRAAITQSKEAGASGFVSKDLDLERILAAIDAVARGEEIFEHTPAAPSSGDATRSGELAALIRFLTPREREVLQRLVTGQATASLAREMGVTYSTARTHIQTLLAKLGVHSKLEAVALAARHMTVTQRSRF